MPLLNRSMPALLLVALFSCGGGGTTNPATNPLFPSAVVMLDSPVESVILSSQATPIVVSGTVAVRDAAPAPGVLIHNRHSTFMVDEYVGTIGANGSWEVSFAPSVGLNIIRGFPTVPAGVQVVGAEFVYVYNPGFEWEQDIALSYDAYIDGMAPLVIQVQTNDPTIDPNTLQAIVSSRVTYDSPISALWSSPLRDDGIAPDLVASDGMYAGEFDPGILSGQVGEYTIYASGETNTASHALRLSSLVPFHVGEALTGEEFESITELMDSIDLRLEGPSNPQDYMSELESVMQDFSGNPLVVGMQSSIFGPGMTVQFRGGLSSVHAYRESGSLGSAGPSGTLSVTPTPNPRPLNTAQGCQEHPSNHVLSMSYYPHQFSSGVDAEIFLDEELPRYTAAAARSNPCLDSQQYDYYGAGAGELPTTQIGGQSLVCIQTHGVIKEFGGDFLTALATNMEWSTLYYFANILRFSSGELVSISPEGVRTVGVTSRYLREVCGNLDGAVVVINACESATLPDIQNMFLGKGAGVYVGWRGSVNSLTAVATLGPWLTPFITENGQCAWEHLPQGFESPTENASLVVSPLEGTFDVNLPQCGGGPTTIFWDPCQNAIFGSATEGVQSSQCRTTFGVSPGQVIADIAQVELESSGSSPGYPFSCGTNPLDCAFDLRLELEHVNTGTTVLLYQGPVVTAQGGVTSLKFSDSGTSPGLWIGGAGEFRSAEPLSSLVGLDASSELCFKLTFTIPASSSASAISSWVYCANAILSVQ